MNWLWLAFLAIGTVCITPRMQAQQVESARMALALGDTSAAVRDLERIATDRPLSPDGLAAFFLVDWIARSGAQDDWADAARAVRDQYLATSISVRHETIRTGAFADAVQIVLREWTDLARSTRRQRTSEKPETQGHGRSSLDSVADAFDSRAPTIAAAARWVRVWRLLQDLDRAAADVPRVPATILPVCPSGCNASLTPPEEYQLAARLSAEPTASTLADLVRLLGDLETAPEPFNWLGARAHVALCALLLGAPAAGCWPRPDRLVGRDSAEVAVMIHVFQGKHGLASRVMDARPAWFAPLTTQWDLLDGPDSVLRLDTTFQIGRTFITSRLVAAPRPSSTVELSPEVFWRLAWPLYLQPYNERLVVHCGRLLLADVVRRLAVNGEPLFMPVGDPVRIIRSGVPLAVVRLIRSPRSMGGGRMTTIRVYVPPTMQETSPAQGAQSVPWAPIALALAAAERPRYSAATGFVSEDYRRLSTIDHQLVQYIRAGHRQFDVYTSWIPPTLCATARPLLGLVWLDSTLQERHRDIEIDLAAHPHARFSTTLDAGTYLYSLELLDRGCQVAGRSRSWIKVPPAEGAFISDLMLADRLFQGDTTRVAWRVAGDPMATMSASRWVRAGTPVRLYWEVYGVSTPAVEADRLAVTFAVVDTKRQRVPVSELAALADQTRRTRGALELTYDLSVPPGTEPLGCGIAFGMPADARGLYVARITVTDTHTGKAASAERAFLVRR